MVPMWNAGRLAVWTCAVFAAVCVWMVSTVCAQEADAPAAGLEKAVKALRNIDPKTVADHEQADRIEEAWKTIHDAGDAGIARMREELKALDRTKKRDDVFRLIAATVFWYHGGKLADAEDIAAQWAVADVSINYEYQFRIAFEAASTHDPRALPMLMAFTKSEGGSVLLESDIMDAVDDHSGRSDMEGKFHWPQTHEILWGRFGSGARPALREVLASPKSEKQVAVAVKLLSRWQDLDSLPVIRKLARTRKGIVRCESLVALGLYGHPDDYDTLAKALVSRDPAEVCAAEKALTFYGDERPVPRLIFLLKSGNRDVSEGARRTLMYLMTVEAVDALMAHNYTIEEYGEKFECNGGVALLGPDAEDWPEMDPAAKEAYVRRRNPRRSFEPEGARRMTRQEFDGIIRRIRESRRVPDGEEVDWDAFLDIATPDDIPRLIDARADLFDRPSPLRFRQADMIDAMIQWIGWRRYRKNPGVCEKVEAR